MELESVSIGLALQIAQLSIAVARVYSKRLKFRLLARVHIIESQMS